MFNQPILSAALITALSAGSLLAANSVSFLGTGAPPKTAGPYSLVPFGPDPTPEFTLVPSVASPLGGNLTFGSPLEHLYVPYSWGSWSHGYEGDVYATDPNTISLTLSLPAGTGAFVLYAEPAGFTVNEFSVSESSGASVVNWIDGDSGAAGFLFRAAIGDALGSIVIASTAPFTVGEFSIAAVPEASTAWAAVALVGACGITWRRRVRP